MTRDHGASDMFNCSNCGHEINDARVPLPPFCPRCGQPSGSASSPFDDDDDDEVSPLPPPPPMSAPPLPAAGRGVPSKTLFGMPGLNFEDDGGVAFPSDDDDDDLPLPSDDDESSATPLAKPVAPPLRSSPPVSKPPPAAIRPPPSAGAAKPKPPALRPPTVRPAKLGGTAKKPPGGVKPPPLPGKRGAVATKAVAKPPPLPSARRAPAPPPLPPPPKRDAFASGVLPADSGAVGRSGSFDEDPFFTGDPERMPELGSITQGDETKFGVEPSGVQEFEFNDDGDSLELGDLDLPTASEIADNDRLSAARSHRPADISAPDFAGLNLSAMEDQVAAGSGEDLEFGEFGDPSQAAGFALPAPVHRSRAMVDDPDLPTPAGFGDELDLPTPVGGSEFDLPTPVEDARLDLDLPTPVDEMDLGEDFGMDDLPMPAADLPGHADDFPAPTDQFAAPDLGDDFGRLESLPAANLPKSADILPASLDSLELDLDDEDRNQRDPQRDSAKGPAGSRQAKPGVPKQAGEPSTSTRADKNIPTSDPPKRDVVRYLVYGLLGLAVIGVGGGYIAMEMGAFDPEPLPIAPPADDDSADRDQAPEPPSGEPSERSEELLAKFDLDTPAAYVEVLGLTKDDPVAQAEAALLLHYRYGPDPERLAQAAKLIAPYQEGAEQPFVRRVIGLGLLAADRHEQALALLDADEPRSQLYRAWVLLEQGQPEAARTLAEAVVAARANDQAAQLAVLQARLAADPVKGLAALRQAAASSVTYLALHEALMEAALAQGRLDEAATIGQALQLGTVSASHKAELLRRRGGIAAAQGRTGAALRLFEQALATDEDLLAARLDRVELWLANKDFPSIRVEIDLLTREHPSDPAVLKLAARVELEAGRDEDARERLAVLGEAAASDPEVHDILGQAHALRIEVDKARAAYAEARKLDPFYVPATIHEIELLVDIEQPKLALRLLDEQRASLDQAETRATSRGRRALASIEHQRALLDRSRGEFEQALAAIEAAIKINPADNDTRLVRALLLEQLGQRKAHVEALHELYERTGGYPGLTEPLGKVLLRQRELDELEALIGTSLDNPEATREILLTGAALRLAQDRVAQAKSYAQRALDRNPTDNRAHLLLGRALLAEGEYERALEQLESAQTREGDPEAELWLGQGLEYNGRPNQARGHYKRALELDPNNLEAAALLGRLYAYQGAARKAMALLEPVIAQTNDYPYAYLALGLAQRDLNQRELAVASFRKAQRYDPTLFEAYYQEGRIHSDKNRHAAAVKALQTGVDKAAELAAGRQLLDAWRRLGESYVELGRRAEAKRALDEYMKLAPPNAAGRREVERLLRDL